MSQKTENNDLIVRYFSGNVTVEEQQQLLAWVNESPDNEQQLFVLKDIYEAGSFANLSAEAQTEAGWRQLLQTMLRSKPTKPVHQKTIRIDWTGHIRKYAAIFIIGVLLGALAVYFSDSRSSDETWTIVTNQFEIRTEKGERATVLLPDGSKVVLNACSFLSYPADFGEKTRELALTGEGYFDVQTNPDIPFTVKTSGLNIRAFGTVFNVRAYSDEDMIETTLVEGSVSIETQTGTPVVSLKPAQVITIPKELIRANREHEYSSRTANEESATEQNVAMNEAKHKAKEAVLIEKINLEVYTSWKDNKWVIESESLESLATKIERKYDVTIIIKEESIKNYVFSGTLKNYPLEQILETIRLNAPIQYTVNEKNVIISEDKQLIKRYENLIQSPF